MRKYSNVSFFFFNDTATTEIYTYRHTLSLHAALPISRQQAYDTGRPLDRADRVAGLRQRHFVNSNEERREEGAHPRLCDHNANGRDEQIEERSNRNPRAHRFSEALTLLPFRRTASVVSSPDRLSPGTAQSENSPDGCSSDLAGL